MDTPTQAGTRIESDVAMRLLDCRWLLALYAIIPLALAVVIVDAVMLDGILLRQYLPADPERWPFWTVVFGLPHIIASLLTMADKEYLSHYRHSLFWPLAVFALIAAGGYFGPQPHARQLLFIFFAFYTIYHVLAQQLGLTLMMLGTPPSLTYRLWKWLSVFAGFAIYVNVYGQARLGHWAIGPLSLYELLAYAAAALCAGTIVQALRLSRTAKHAVGIWYLWGNVALLASAFLINEIGYTLFVILVPRVIHDVTAYMVYITHDTNRNRERPVNLVYRLTCFTRLPPVLLLPLLSVAIAYLLSSYQHYALVGIVILTLSFLHYYFEGFIWRGPNPHRAHMSFKR